MQNPRQRCGALRRDRKARQGLETGPGRGAGGRWQARPRQISHIIYGGNFSRPRENVAIPTR